MKALAILLLAAGMVLCADAQNAPLTFDAASIRPAAPMSREELIAAKSSAESLSVAASPGGLTMRDVTLKQCIGWAYGINAGNQISGGPNWMASDRFDIVTRTVEPATQDQLRMMLQSLLADRFQLSLHRESREVTVQVLSVGKNGWKQPPVEKKRNGVVAIMRSRSGLPALTAQQASMADLAQFLSRVSQTPVTDMTGITGSFDFSVDLSVPFQDDGKYSVEPYLLVAAVQQLGLKLESRKTPTEILIIDRAERPSEN